MSLHPYILVKRNVKLPDRRTSVQLEAYVWQSIDAILSLESIKFSLSYTELDQRKKEIKLASSMRLFALTYYRTLSNLSMMK
jgi:predicted DNA-binding ribbon-helix-helix protein